MKLKVKGIKGIIQFSKEPKIKRVKVKGLTNPVIFHTPPEDLKNIIFNSYLELLRSVFNLEDFNWHANPPNQGIYHSFETKDFENLFDYEVQQKDEAYGEVWFAPPSNFNWYDKIKVRIRPYVNPAIRGTNAGYIKVKCSTCDLDLSIVYLVSLHEDFFQQQPSLSDLFNNHRNHLIQVEMQVKGYKNNINKSYQFTPYFTYSNNTNFWINEQLSASVDSGGWATTSEIIVVRSDNQASYSVSQNSASTTMQRYLAMTDPHSGTNGNNNEWSNLYNITFRLKRGTYTKEYTAQASVKSHDRFSLSKTDYHLTEYPATIQNVSLNWTPPAWGNENTLTVPDCVIDEGNYEPTKPANIKVRFKHDSTTYLTVSRTRSITQRKTARYNPTETIITNDFDAIWNDTKDFSGVKIAYYVPLVLDDGYTRGFIGLQSGNTIRIHYINSSISINNPLSSSLTFNTHIASTLSTSVQTIKGVFFGWGSAVKPFFPLRNPFPFLVEYVVAPKGINFKYFRGNTQYTVSIAVSDLHSSEPFDIMRLPGVSIAERLNPNNYPEHILVFIPYKDTGGNAKTLVIMIKDNSQAFSITLNENIEGYFWGGKAPREFRENTSIPIPYYEILMQQFTPGAVFNYSQGITFQQPDPNNNYTFAVIGLSGYSNIENFYGDHFDFSSTRYTSALPFINTPKFVGYISDKLHILVKETISRGAYSYGTHNHQSPTSPSWGSATSTIIIPTIPFTSITATPISYNNSISFNYDTYF